MNKKIFLVIQGHTKHYKEVLENVKDVENVIWSTEDNMPEEHLNEIRNSNVKLILSPKPDYNGYGNVNIQVQSTVKGLYFAKELGATHAIKVRSDLIFKNPTKFINEYNFDDKIHQLFYCKHTPSCINITNHYPNLISWIESNYPNFITDVSDYNYICDFSNLGPIDEMILFWSLPFEESENRNPAEFKFILRYLKMKGFEKVQLNYEWLSLLFPFYATYCKETDNPLISLKNGWTTTDLFGSVDVLWIG
jgi:hypothetical protein